MSRCIQMALSALVLVLSLSSIAVPLVQGCGAPIFFDGWDPVERREGTGDLGRQDHWDAPLVAFSGESPNASMSDHSNSTFQFGGGRDDINWKDLLASRNWDKGTLLQKLKDGSQGSSELQNFPIQSGAAVDPSLAGLLCSMDGVSIKSHSGYVFYNSKMTTTAVKGASKLGCLWIVDFPPFMNDDTLVAVSLVQFTSTHPATFKVFSGSSSCPESGNTYANLELNGLGYGYHNTTVEAVSTFVPPRDNAIAIQMEILFVKDGIDIDPSAEPYFAIDLDFYPLVKHEHTPSDVHTASLEETVDEDGVLEGELSLYASDVEELSDYLPTLTPNGGDITEAQGIYILNNERLRSLDGLESITWVHGPIVIKNNAHLDTPFSWVVNWLSQVEGDVTSIDLSFNRFTGEIPSEICEVMDRLTPLIDLSNNLGLCGELPECLHDIIEDYELEFEEYYEEDYPYDHLEEDFESDDSHSHDDDEEEILISPELAVVLPLQLSKLHAGNQIGTECSQTGSKLKSHGNNTVLGCKPLGYTGDLDKQGFIMFDDLSLRLQETSPPSCSWQAPLEEYTDYVFFLDFHEFYSSVSQDRERCSEISSGHNFYSPVLNGPIVQEFTVSLFNETFRRGLDVVTMSGSEIPPPAVFKIDKSLDKVHMGLKEKNTWQTPCDIDVLDEGRKDLPCGATDIFYSMEKPIQSSSALSSFVAEHLDKASGVLGESLFISGCEKELESPIKDLSSLADVKEVQGSLAILECGTLESLQGLNQLEHVSQSLILQDNPDLSTVAALGSLKSLGGSLVFRGNANMDALSGLASVDDIGSSLVVEKTNLGSFEGLDKVTHIGGQLIIQNNQRLSSLRGLSSLAYVDSSVTVKFNPTLSSFSGLEFLMQVNGSLDIQYNPAIRNMTGLENLIAVNGSVGIMNNDHLQSVNHFLSLQHVLGSMVITGNEALESVNLPAIENIGGPLPSPDNFRYAAYMKMQETSGSAENHILAIESNYALEEVIFSENLKKLPANVHVVDNSLTGHIPVHWLEMGVRHAAFSWNDFSGPIDPSICSLSSLHHFDVSGNPDLCGSLPHNCDVEVVAEMSGIGYDCEDWVPPKCAAESPDNCSVISVAYSQDPLELSFTFPKYTTEVANDEIGYRFAVGTAPGANDVSDMAEIKADELSQMSDSPEMLKFAWKLKDRHISMVHGQKYYVTVDAVDTMGAASDGISSDGTLIDIIPPETKNAEVDLDVSADGQFKVHWKGFEAASGVQQYKISLMRDGKDFNESSVTGAEGYYMGQIDPSSIKNGTAFSVSVVGIGGSGLESPPVISEQVTPLGPATESDQYSVLGVILGVIFGSLFTGVVVSLIVFRILRKQKRQNQRREWLQRLNNSVYTYLQGSASGGSGSEDDSSSVLLQGYNDENADDAKEAVFVFTDIQSSTKLCEQDAQAFMDLQEIHDEIVRNALAETHGHEVDTEGDAFQCLFADVADALNFCFITQQNLLECEWPQSVYNLYGCEKVKSQLYRGKLVWSGPRVRMGVHIGYPGEFWTKSHPTTRRLTFAGEAWEVTKIMADAGHGGQILVSHAAWKHLINNSAEGAAGFPIFEDLGSFQIGFYDDAVAPMRFLQAAPARSPLSERSFEVLRNVLMLEPGKGLNTVPAPEGRVAVVGLVMDAQFNEVVDRFIKAIASRAALFRERDVEGSPISPIGINSNANDWAHENNGKQVGIVCEDEEKGSEVHFTLPNTSKAADSAFSVVQAVIQSLVSQFGGYIIPSVEETAVPSGCMLIAFKSCSAAIRFALASQTTLMEYPWPASVLHLPGMKNIANSDGIPYFSGPRVAMSCHVCVLKESRATIDRGSDRNKIQGSKTKRNGCTELKSSLTDNDLSYKCDGLLQAAELADIASGGQVILSSQFSDSHWQRGLSLSQTHVTDLGVHDIKYFSGAQKLIEILPKVLQERSKTFPPVDSQRILSVGAHEAPGTKGGNVALVFTYPRVAHVFQKSVEATNAVDNFSETVRILLGRYNGYESQEVGTGCFFLSFATLEDAISWSIHAQLVLRRSAWNRSEHVAPCSEPESAPQSPSLRSVPDVPASAIEAKSSESLGEGSSDSLFSFRLSSDSAVGGYSRGFAHRDVSGLADPVSQTPSIPSSSFPACASSLQMKHLVLAQIGIVYGCPTKVSNHVMSGRADYFGPIVNLTARVAKSTEPGEVHMSSYEKLPSSSKNRACILRGSEFPDGDHSVDISILDYGKHGFKGVQDKHTLYAVKVTSDPFLAVQDQPHSIPT